MEFSVIADIQSLINLAIGPIDVNFALLKTILQLFASQIERMASVRVQLVNFPYINDNPTEIKHITINDANLFPTYSVQASNPDEPFNPNECILTPEPFNVEDTVKTLVVVDKHATIVTKVASGPAANTDAYTNVGKGIRNRLSTLEKRYDVINEILERLNIDEDDIDRLKQDRLSRSDSVKDGLQVPMPNNLYDDIMNILKENQLLDLNNVSCDCENLKQRLENFENQIQQLELNAHSLYCRLDQIDEDILANREAISQTQINFDLIPDKLEDISGIYAHTEPNQTVTDSIQLEKYQEQLDALQSAICRIEKDLFETMEHTEQLLKCCNESRAHLSIYFERLEANDALLVEHQCSIDLLFEHVKNLQYQNTVFDEKLEHIKCIVAYQEEMDERLALKADRTEVQTKVEMYAFEHAKRELSSGIIDSLEKIIESDSGWHISVKELFNTIQNTKTDKAEFTAKVKDLSTHISELRQRIVEFSMYRISCESAATAQKYIKDVKCIICNATTYMKPQTNIPCVPKLLQMPKPSKRIVRRITIPCNNNIVKPPDTVNRLCGGKHTIIRPEERVMTKGDYRDQINCLPSTSILENLEEGDDGALYRVDKTLCKCYQI